MVQSTRTLTPRFISEIDQQPAQVNPLLTDASMTSVPSRYADVATYGTYLKVMPRDWSLLDQY